MPKRTCDICGEKKHTTTFSHKELEAIVSALGLEIKRKLIYKEFAEVGMCTGWRRKTRVCRHCLKPFPKLRRFKKNV